MACRRTRWDLHAGCSHPWLHSPWMGAHGFICLRLRRRLCSLAVRSLKHFLPCHPRPLLPNIGVLPGSQVRRAAFWFLPGSLEFDRSSDPANRFTSWHATLCVCHDLAVDSLPHGSSASIRVFPGVDILCFNGHHRTRPFYFPVLHPTAVRILPRHGERCISGSACMVGYA